MLNPDLIDTQWNVNEYVYMMFQKNLADLIDTQWNVNQRGQKTCTVNVRFNRYIVECKFEWAFCKGNMQHRI